MFGSFVRTLLILFHFNSVTSAVYHSSSNVNLAVYWGQGPNQFDLQHYCRQPEIDIIPIGFLNVFPAQGNKNLNTNFGNKCFAAPQLRSRCPSLKVDIPACQKIWGKKIILSLGGGTNDYQLTGEQDGIAFADLLWGTFGPRTDSWVAAGKPRPFDGPLGEEVQVDGFDMDIEYPQTDESAGYIAMLRRLRQRFAEEDKHYILSGAPQCVVRDVNMANMIEEVAFDMLFIQFYNTPFCSARNFITNNGKNSGFSYDHWSESLVGTASANAKLYIGLPSSPNAASGAGLFWLTPTEVTTLIQEFSGRENFGGVMLWEATMAENQMDQGRTYYQNIKSVLRQVAGAVNQQSTFPSPPTSTATTEKSGTLFSPFAADAKVYDGDITYYFPDLGACGIKSDANDKVCAVSHILYDSVPGKTGNTNENSLCGKKIRVSRKDERDGQIKSVDVTVVDRCVKCKENDVDLSPNMFKELAMEELGRVRGKWSWLD